MFSYDLEMVCVPCVIATITKILHLIFSVYIFIYIYIHFSQVSLRANMLLLLLLLLSLRAGG